MCTCSFQKNACILLILIDCMYPPTIIKRKVETLLRATQQITEPLFDHHHLPYFGLREDRSSAASPILTATKSIASSSIAKALTI